MKSLKIAIFAVLTFLGVFTGVAVAAGAAEASDGSLMDLFTPVVDAFRGGDYPFAAAVMLVFLVAVTKKYGGNRFPFLASGKGNALLVLLGSFGGAMATALAGEGTLSGHVAWTATGIAVAAAGGYSLIKTLIVEPLQDSDWYKNKAPGWVKSALSFALWIFNKPSPVATAEAAGQAAVDKDPPTGTGTPTEIK